MATRGKPELGRATRLAMISQFLGFMLDTYDMALVLVMAPILLKVFSSPAGSEAWRYVIIVLTYSITTAARPIGSIIFGHYADKVGRRFLLVFTIGGVGAMSFISAFLPTYAQWGVWSYLLFCLMRFVMGVFFGGEYAVGHTFAIEHAPRGRRGVIGGFVQSGFPLGYVLGSLVFALISYLVGTEAMLDYGWRIGFLTGVLPVFLALYIRRLLPESPEFEKVKKQGTIEKAPFLSMFKPPALWDLLQVFFFMTGLFLTTHSIYAFLPNILTLGGRGFDNTTYSLIYGFGLFTSCICMIFYGWWSDIIGRKILTMYYCVFLAIVAVPVCYVTYYSAVNHNLWLAVVGATLAANLKLYWGVIPAYLSERFPTKRRAVGVGFGYSAGGLFGAWFGVYIWWVHGTPFIAAIEKQDMWLSSAVIMTVGAIMTFVSLLFSPETKDLELSEV
jgi:MFS family permease